MFVPPTWFDGTLFYLFWILVPLIIGIVIGAIGLAKNSGILTGIGIIGVILAVIMVVGGASVIWHYQYEVPSVQSEIITIDEWQPTFGHYWGEVSGAGDLMLKTTDGRLFGNNENFLFGKFNTRDIFDQLKPNGTYKITYYGWREGYNNGVPNILSIDEVVNETNTPTHHDISNYMNKRSIIYQDDDDNW
jgi:hypothetical protein